MVEALAARPRPVEQLDRAVDGRAFLVAGDRKLIEPLKAPRATKRSAAASAAATPPFMSAAPRPQSWPSATSPANGMKRQRAASPGGTTSVWPAKTKFGASRPKRA